MAFSVKSGTNGGGRRNFRNAGSGALSEINIIPLVDVVLVLLIIFMLTAHVMEFGMEVDVPKTQTQKSATEVLPVINVMKGGNVFLVDKPVNINEIGPAVQKRFGNVKGVYLRADKLVPWEVLANVIAALDKAKLGVKLVTQPVENVRTNR